MAEMDLPVAPTRLLTHASVAVPVLIAARDGALNRRAGEQALLVTALFARGTLFAGRRGGSG